MPDLSQFFKSPMQPINRGESKKRTLDFKLLLTPGANGYSINTVNEKREPIHVDDKLYSGSIRNFLRAYNQAANHDSFADSIGWGSAARSRGVSLNDFPELLDMAHGVIDVIDIKDNNITFDTALRRIALTFTGIENNNDTKSTNFNLCLGFETTNDSLDSPNEDNAESAADSNNHVAINIVTADYAYSTANKTIYPIENIGPNFANLDSFRYNTFSKADLPDVMSLLLSYFCNIAVQVVEMSDERGVIDFDIDYLPIMDRYKPTLVFEEVDSQNALYIRLKATASGIAPELSDLGLTATVSFDPDADDRILVKQIKTIDLSDYEPVLRAAIDKSAPSRKDLKEALHMDNLYILPESMAGNFLFNQLPSLLGDFRILGADKLKSYKVKAVTPKLDVRLSSGIDFLGGTANVTIDQQTFSLADLIKRYTANRYVQLADGTRAIIDSEYMRRLERIYKHNRGKKGEFKISFFDLPEIEYLLNSKLEGEAVKAPRTFYQGFTSLRNDKLTVPGLKAKLRPYQTEGVKWIKYLYDNNIGGCLADDMGLGKTIQTISVLLTVYRSKKGANLAPSLIVMPKSLLFNWRSELERFAPGLSVHTYYGTGRLLDEALKAQIVLTTYSVVRNDIEQLEKQHFHYVILDESQNIKNTASQATRAVWMLNADHRLAISGTPIENNLTELYSLFRFLNPTMFGTLDDFNERYTYPIQKQDSQECAEELRRKIFPFILRRLKKNVLSDLPDLTEQILRVEMDDSHRQYYEKRRGEYYDMIHNQISEHGLNKSQFMLLQALSELRRIASIPESLTDGRIHSPKMPLLVEKIEDAVSGSHKVVVFFNFIAGLDIAADHLRHAGIDFETMTGATQNRQEVVNRFQNTPNCKVLLMTLKTGGVGLNLTAADTVMIFEPWWNKAAEMQAINRLHRIGQKAKVMSYSIITEDTIEERILELQQQKTLLVDNIISTDGIGKHLTEEDINFILK